MCSSSHPCFTLSIIIPDASALTESFLVILGTSSPALQISSKCAPEFGSTYSYVPPEKTCLPFASTETIPGNVSQPTLFPANINPPYSTFPVLASYLELNICRSPMFPSTFISTSLLNTCCLLNSVSIPTLFISDFNCLISELIASLSAILFVSFDACTASSRILCTISMTSSIAPSAVWIHEIPSWVFCAPRISPRICIRIFSDIFKPAALSDALLMRYPEESFSAAFSFFPLFIFNCLAVNWDNRLFAITIPTTPPYPVLLCISSLLV